MKRFEARKLEIRKALIAYFKIMKEPMTAHELARAVGCHWSAVQRHMQEYIPTQTKIGVKKMGQCSLYYVKPPA